MNQELNNKKLYKTKNFNNKNIVQEIYTSLY